MSFLRLTRPDAEFDDAIPPYDARVYDRARDNFQLFLKKGYLFHEPKPCLYVYSQSRPDHSQTGVVCTVQCRDYLEGRILKHEKTREEKESDRTRLIEHLGAHLEPVFLTHRPDSALRELVETVLRDTVPDYDFETPDGVRQRFHPIASADRISAFTRLFEGISRFYIADGHHRAASAARVFENASKRQALSLGAGHFPAVIFASDQLRILPYHRLIASLNGLDAAEFLGRLEADFRIESPVSRDRALPRTPRSFGMFLNGAWHLLTLKQETPFPDDPVSSLDASLLDRLVFKKHLGIDDPRTDPRLDFVGGIHGLDKLETPVREGRMKLAVTLHASKMEDLIRVSDRRGLMPPKSTWFDPKLQSGLFAHHFKDTP
jgi:uncharacterized protein (DUF1015 family)